MRSLKIYWLKMGFFTDAQTVLEDDQTNLYGIFGKYLETYLGYLGFSTGAQTVLGVCQTNWIRRQRYILVITLPRTLKSKRNFVYRKNTSSKKPLSKHCIVWIGVDLWTPKSFLCRRKETQFRWNCAPSELSVMTMATMGKIILMWWYSKRNMNEWQLFCKG